MGQAFRKASGRIRSSAVDTPSSSSSSQLKKAAERRQQAAVPADMVAGDNAVPDSEGESVSRVNAENLLEERNPEYDSMLSQMVGRIQAKPGGKLGMGEAFIVEKNNRPLPKLRNTTGTGRYEERPAPPGTLNVAQLRHIILLHQGKAEDHNGPMNVEQIAEKFRMDVAQVQTILQFVSVPPEDSSEKRNDRQ